MHVISQPVKSLLNIHLQEFRRHKNKNGGRSLKRNFVALGSKNNTADKKILISIV